MGWDGDMTKECTLKTPTEVGPRGSISQVCQEGWKTIRKQESERLR